MRTRLLWTVSMGSLLPVACLVPSFEVATSEAQGGRASAGAGGSSGGSRFTTGGDDSGATGGVAGAGMGGEASGGAGSPSGGSAQSGASSGAQGGTAGRTNGGASSGGASSGGSVSASGGNPGGAGGGETGGTGGGEVTTGPYRVGYSEYHDSQGGEDNGSGTMVDAKLALPAGTKAGDLLFVFFGADHNLRTFSSNELSDRGWTLLYSIADHFSGVDGQGTYLFYKFATGSEPDPIVFAGINPERFGVQGLLSVYRGVNPAHPVDAFETYVDPTATREVTHLTAPTPSITTTVDDCLLIAGLSPDSTIDRPVISMWPNGFTENRTSVTNPAMTGAQAAPGWANIYTAERRSPKAGTIAASSFAWDLQQTTENYGVVSFVLALAPP